MSSAELFLFSLSFYPSHFSSHCFRRFLEKGKVEGMHFQFKVTKKDEIQKYKFQEKFQ